MQCKCKEVHITPESSHQQASGSLGDRAAWLTSNLWLALKLGGTVKAHGHWVMAPQAWKHIVSFVQVPTSDIPGTSAAAALLSTTLYSACTQYPVSIYQSTTIFDGVVSRRTFRATFLIIISEGEMITGVCQKLRQLHTGRERGECVWEAGLLGNNGWQ